MLYGIPFSEDERQTMKFLIQRNLFGYLGILLEGRERFEEESLLEKRKRCVTNKSGPSGMMRVDSTYFSFLLSLYAILFCQLIYKNYVKGMLKMHRS